MTNFFLIFAIVFAVLLSLFAVVATVGFCVTYCLYKASLLVTGLRRRSRRNIYDRAV